MPRSLGSIYTPADIAQMLADWAIQDKHQKVLDIGVGEGAFTFAAYKRLERLGARSATAQAQIYGAEIHLPTYKRFINLAQQSGFDFPNVRRADFFATEYPSVTAAIGNPPYVRRSSINGIESVRESARKSVNSPHANSISRMADLYVYFLFKAASLLEPGGRLAVITADSWLNSQYGIALKNYLKENFRIESLVSFDRQLFAAEVKSVLLFATKKTALPFREQPVSFIRVKNGLAPREVLHSFTKPRVTMDDLIISRVSPRKLQAERPWGDNLKVPGICDELVAHNMMTPLSKLGRTSIGIQTLAKEFFVLLPEQVQQLQIEPEYLAPLASSSRTHQSPCIEPGSAPKHYLFYCAKGKPELVGTRVLDYIENAEQVTVPVRGKEKTVVGYQNKERIQRARRLHWYDLRSADEQRGRARILIPRLIHRKCQVVWNRAQFIPGELFIGFTPNGEHRIEDEIYLAILTSSLTELFLRANSQLYGGGTYNISPGQIGSLRVLDATRLSQVQRASLKQAYCLYLADTRHNRELLDRALFDILELSPESELVVKNALEELIALGLSSKHSTNPKNSVA